MQDRNMQQSVDLARAIQRNYTSSGRRNKGVHQAGFLVLRATSMPSVLTELGFISNAEEEKFLHSRQGVETLARAIFEGFKAYRQKHHAEMCFLPKTRTMKAKPNLWWQKQLPYQSLCLHEMPCATQ